MRIGAWTAAAAITGSLLIAATPAVAAPTATTEVQASDPIEWSVTHGTATSTGERWMERETGKIFPDLVLDGQLENTGEGCSSVWIRFQFDMAPVMPVKHAEVCGAGTAEFNLRQQYMPTTTASLSVCEGTENTQDCAPWESMTRWPVKQD